MQITKIKNYINIRFMNILWYNVHLIAMYVYIHTALIQLILTYYILTYI